MVIWILFFIFRLFLFWFGFLISYGLIHRKRNEKILVILIISEYPNNDRTSWIETKTASKKQSKCVSCVWFSVIIPVINTLCKYPVITELIAALILMMMMMIVKKKKFSFSFSFFFDSLILLHQVQSLYSYSVLRINQKKNLIAAIIDFVYWRLRLKMMCVVNVFWEITFFFFFFC